MGTCVRDVTRLAVHAGERGRASKGKGSDVPGPTLASVTSHTRGPQGPRPPGTLSITHWGLGRHERPAPRRSRWAGGTPATFLQAGALPGEAARPGQGTPRASQAFGGREKAAILASEGGVPPPSRTQAGKGTRTAEKEGLRPNLQGHLLQEPPRPRVTCSLCAPSWATAEERAQSLQDRRGDPNQAPSHRTAESNKSSGNAKIGHRAPQFKATAVMPDGQFKDTSLSDYKGKYVVFFFYPLDFTFVCPTEITAFSDGAEELKKLNCQVIGASVDSHFCHLAWINTPKKQGGLGPKNIPLISDPKCTIAQDHGVLKANEGISFRGLFIIDDKGILRQITINDLPVGHSVDETLRLVQAFQSTDKHGQVCPAGWNPGSDTIKPDVQKSQECFSKQK
ncbi:peroxiredoxin-1-like [Eubalaena glacialis]|uniref:peroxiredoxin-1-like n=1 Tax=Eubalaena glacialis TaxID=27606 RepID=UPI002A5AF7F7|nr:peroxiredoxin-1-like [Eubalaena glacialis]